MEVSKNICTEDFIICQNSFYFINHLDYTYKHIYGKYSEWTHLSYSLFVIWSWMMFAKVVSIYPIKCLDPVLCILIDVQAHAPTVWTFTGSDSRELLGPDANQQILDANWVATAHYKFLLGHKCHRFTWQNAVTGRKTITWQRDHFSRWYICELLLKLVSFRS